MKSKVVTYQNGEYDLTLTVREATARDGIKRIATIERERAFMAVERSSELTLGDVMGIQYYANCVATTDIESRGACQLPAQLSFDDFMGLPETLVDIWLDTVLEVNPHWQPQRRPQGEAKEPSE